MTTIALSALRFKRSAWSRIDASPERVAMFEALYREGAPVPPLEVMAMPDGTYWVVDGVNRWSGAIRAGVDSVEVILVQPNDGESPEDFAFRRGLETATRSSQPLSSAERKRATLKLVATQPERSKREIARLVGVAHSTVDRWVREAQGNEGGADGEIGSAEYTRGPTAADVARRIATYLDHLDESRGLFDMVAQVRMGKHLALALRDRFGDDALAQAERFANWTAGAVAQLKSGP